MQAIVFTAHYPVAVVDKKQKKIEDLRLHRQQVVSAA
jgi:hypothetical protein